MNYKNLDDYDLLYQIRVDDKSSIDVLIKKYEPIIVGMAKKFYPRVKYQGADMNDLIQEGRIAVMKAVNAYDENDALFYTYVSVCLKNHLITYCRSLSSCKHNALNYSVGEEYSYNISDISFEPDEYLSCKRMEELIINGMYDLKFIDSCVFELRYNGFSYKEISDLLDISLSSVSRRLCKIRRSLQLLKDKF